MLLKKGGYLNLELFINVSLSQAKVKNINVLEPNKNIQWWIFKI
jgi:hypothetical protein